MMKNSKIGLVVWGGKKGRETFFNSQDIDLSDKEIRETTDDLRDTFSFLKHGQYYYSLEFTSKYKVFTEYFSLFDWEKRNRSYLAITIYIPKAMKIKNSSALDVLNELTEYYLKNYYDSSLYMISKRREDPQAFFNIISKYELETVNLNRIGTWKSSINLNKIGLVRYANRSNLNTFFENPFRKEFSDYKEVFFLIKDCENENYINKSSSIIDIEVSLNEQLYNLELDFKDRNGIDIYPQVNINGKSYSNSVINDLHFDDKVEIKVHKANYTEYRLPPTRVDELIINGFTQNGNVYKLTKNLLPKLEEITFSIYDRNNNFKINENGKLYINNQPHEIKGGSVKVTINPFESYELSAASVKGYKVQKLTKQSGEKIINNSQQGIYRLNMHIDPETIEKQKPIGKSDTPNIGRKVDNSRKSNGINFYGDKDDDSSEEKNKVTKIFKQLPFVYKIGIPLISLILLSFLTILIIDKFSSENKNEIVVVDREEVVNERENTDSGSEIANFSFIIKDDEGNILSHTLNYQTFKDGSIYKNIEIKPNDDNKYEIPKGNYDSVTLYIEDYNKVTISIDSLDTIVLTKSDAAIEKTTEDETQAETKKPNPTQVKLDYAITLSESAKFKEASYNWKKGEKLNSFFNKNLKNINKVAYRRLRMMVAIGSGQRSYEDLKGYYLNGLKGTKLNRTQKKALKDIILMKNNNVKEYMEGTNKSFEEALKAF